MFIMSGDSTKEWQRYLFSGSSGWSILKEPAVLLSVPAMWTFPVKWPAQPEVAVPLTAVPAVVSPQTPEPPRVLLTPFTPALIADDEPPITPVPLADSPRTPQ